MDHTDAASKFDSLILSKIEEYRSFHTESFCSPNLLHLSDWAPLLSIILSSDESSHQMNLEACKDFIARNPTLAVELSKAYRLKSFWGVKALIISTLKRENDTDTDTDSDILTTSSSFRSLRTIFEDPYKGDLHLALIETLENYADSVLTTPAHGKAYNRSISIIQSSGTGKSRAVDEAAKIMFTIPINLREGIPSGGYTYPPPDVALRNYFEYHTHKSDALLQAEYAILLKSLFDSVLATVRTIGHGLKEKGLALAWAEYLKQGQDISGVGHKRKELYDNVVVEATNQLAILPTSTNRSEGIVDLDRPADLSQLYSDLQASWKQLQNFLVSQHELERKNICFVYFDEAHSLTEPPPKPTPSRCMSPYHNLGKVLSELSRAPIFFIFLSTNSHLQRFAPPPAGHLSFPVPQGADLFPPFTELPFDVFVPEVLEELSESFGYVSLAKAQDRKLMSCFGRPMWYLHHMLWLSQNERGSKGDLPPNFQDVSVSDIFTFAMDKLTAQGSPGEVPRSKLAAIGVRVGVRFDPSNRLSRQEEARHVESHMRIIYVIPEHREYMWTGTPSEPVLAEVAAFYLDRLSDKGIAVAGPRILAENCRNGILEPSGRGELCGRLLVTVAHDIAIKRLTLPAKLNSPRFHRPVRVIDFLRALFASDHHKTVLGATPVANSFSDSSGQPTTLEQAFCEAFVFFSHFELAKDFQSLGAFQLQFALLRGYALRVEASQVSIDAVIPVHMGSEYSPITPETTSAINLQFRNRKQPDTCPINRSITVPDHKLPAISIVFELGEEPPKSSLVEVYHENHRIPRDQHVPRRDDLHFALVTHGCGPDTFNPVSEDTKMFYDDILAHRTVLDDFSRRDRPASVANLETLSPAWRTGLYIPVSLTNGQ